MVARMLHLSGRTKWQICTMKHPHPTLPAPIADYLRQEINALELATLLDGHLHDTVQLIARSGEPWTEEQNSAYHHIRRLRDLFVELSNAPSAKP